MTSPTSPYEQTLDQAARERELASLGNVLKGPLTMDTLKNWVSENAGVRSPFLQDRVFGKIRWKKSIGRSLGPTLASGFRGEDWFHYLNWAVGPDGVPVDIGKWVQSQEPTFWDMPDDGEFFQVGYGFWGVRPWVNALLLDFAHHQPWDSPLVARVRRGYRRIVPAEQDFYFGSAIYGVLDDATIEEVPIRFF
jgi:hypothetical protein